MTLCPHIFLFFIMVLDLTEKLSESRYDQLSRSELLIAKSILEQRLSEAVKGFVYWQTLRTELDQKTESYWDMLQDLLLKGDWDDSYYNNLQQQSRNACREIAKYQYKIDHYTTKLEDIISKLAN